MKSVITHIQNVTSEGVSVVLNQPTKLKSGVMKSKVFFLSWDKIGKELFENYEDSDKVSAFNKLRGEKIF